VEFDDRTQRCPIARTAVIFYTATTRRPAAKILADSVHVPTKCWSAGLNHSPYSTRSRTARLAPLPIAGSETAHRSAFPVGKTAGLHARSGRPCSNLYVRNGTRFEQHQTAGRCRRARAPSLWRFQMLSLRLTTARLPCTLVDAIRKTSGAICASRKDSGWQVRLAAVSTPRRPADALRRGRLSKTRPRTAHRMIRSSVGLRGDAPARPHRAAHAKPRHLGPSRFPPPITHLACSPCRCRCARQPLLDGFLLADRPTATIRREDDHSPPRWAGNLSLAQKSCCTRFQQHTRCG